MSEGPLTGTTVVDLGVWVAGPATAAILADWGADVIKVEPLRGDPMRQAARMGTDGINPMFELDNRNKRSLAVDLEHADGRALLEALLARTDALVSNLRASTLASWSLGADQLRQRHPHLVVATLTGFGEAGPDRDRPSYDLGGFWSRSGLAAAHAIDTDPFPMRSAWGDHMAALSLAGGICAALAGRARTGTGTHVSTSLLRNGLYGLSQDANVLTRLGAWFPYSRHGAPNPLFNVYGTSDGRWLYLLGLQPDRHWPAIAVALGHPEWLADERFVDTPSQRAHQADLRALLEEAFTTRTLAEWTEALEAHGVWWEPVLNLDEVLVDPQVRASGGIVPVRVPGRDEPVDGIATPVDFDGRSAFAQLPPPELGEHGDDVLADLGFDPDEIAGLRQQGILG
ncbi:MAG: coA-transferase family protein [Actinomycetia bacterium]|nr:coA-transferase family protein [Actinomycetes bacterium]